MFYSFGLMGISCALFVLSLFGLIGEAWCFIRGSVRGFRRVRPPRREWAGRVVE